jgi:23S rRNA pseudouridine1911/1915/1917 synthase
MNINIIYEDNHLLVVEKPAGMPIVLDSSQDEDLLSILKGYLKEKYNKPGNVYLGLVHRLDRPVGGICVFAKTSKAASRLSDLIRRNQMVKKYYAVIEYQKDDLQLRGHLEDKLLKDEKTNTTKVSETGKLAVLDYVIMKKGEGLALVDIDLKTGRSHQIRVQFSSRDHALYADHRYGNYNGKEDIALYAYGLEFKHPVKDEVMHFELPLPDKYPFNI